MRLSFDALCWLDIDIQYRDEGFLKGISPKRTTTSMALQKQNPKKHLHSESRGHCVHLLHSPPLTVDNHCLKLCSSKLHLPAFRHSFGDTTACAALSNTMLSYPTPHASDAHLTFPPVTSQIPAERLLTLTSWTNLHQKTAMSRGKWMETMDAALMHHCTETLSTWLHLQAMDSNSFTCTDPYNSISPWMGGLLWYEVWAEEEGDMPGWHCIEEGMLFFRVFWVLADLWHFK